MSTDFPSSPRLMGFVGCYRQPISQALLIRWGWLSFPILWETDEKTHACNEVYHKYDRKKAPMLWAKYEYQFPRI